MTNWTFGLDLTKLNENSTPLICYSSPLTLSAVFGVVLQSASCYDQQSLHIPPLFPKFGVAKEQKTSLTADKNVVLGLGFHNTKSF